MSEPDENINQNEKNNKRDLLLDAFNVLEMKIDSMAIREDLNKYRDKMQELRQYNAQLQSKLTLLHEKEGCMEMTYLLSLREQNKLKKIEQLRKERIKTKITNLCRNQLAITEKLDIQRPLRAPNKKEITADVLIEFENDENVMKLLNNITKLTDCKIIVKKHNGKKSKTKNVENNENENDKKKSMRKFLLRFRQNIKPKKEVAEPIL